MKCRILGPYTIELPTGHCILRAGPNLFVVFDRRTTDKHTAHVTRPGFSTYEAAEAWCVADAAARKAAA